MATTSALFQTLAANWDSTIITGITQSVSTAVTANATLLTSMITLYVIISGIMTMFGRMSMSEWVFGATRCAIIGTLLTAAAFSTYIQTPLMTTIPNWIASNVNGSMGASTGPQQFDALRNAAVAMEAAVLQQTSGFTQFMERARADFATWFICLELATCFIIWELNRAMMGVIVACAPFLLGFYLFRSTRHIVTNLAGQAVTILILNLMVAVLMNLTVQADTTWVHQANVATSVDVALDNMKNIALFFLFGMFMTATLPIIAGRIGHGVVPSISRHVGRGIEMVGGDITRSAGRLSKTIQTSLAKNKGKK